MPPRKWPPAVHHHKPTGQARVRLNGRDYYLGPYGSDRAAREYARLIAEAAAGRDPTPPGPGLTVAEVVARWASQEAPRYSDRGRERREFKYALRPLLRLYAHQPAASFGVRELQAVQLALASGSWLTDEERARARAANRPAGVASGVVNRRVTRIRTLWRWAEREGLAPPGSFAHLCSLPGLRANDRRVRHTRRRKPATWAQVEVALPHCPPQVAAMLLLQWHTGMRSGEVRIMRGCDVERGGPGSVWLYRPHLHKNDWRGQERVVPLGPEAQRVLLPWLESREPDAYLFRPREADEERYLRMRAARKTRVQPSQLRRDHERALRRRQHPSWGACYTACSYPQAVRKACKAASVDPFHPYQLRHAAKMRFAAAAGLEAARAALGQATTSATDRYGELDLPLAVEAARKVG